MPHANRDTLTSSFQFECLFFLCFAQFPWLELPVLCWVEMIRRGILALFQISEERLSTAPCSVWGQLHVCPFHALLCWRTQHALQETNRTLLESQQSYCLSPPCHFTIQLPVSSSHTHKNLNWKGSPSWLFQGYFWEFLGESPEVRTFRKLPEDLLAHSYRYETLQEARFWAGFLASIWAFGSQVQSPVVTAVYIECVVLKHDHQRGVFSF